ncbi:MAG: hypothetical protein ACKVQK_31530, partial [Burkholderiales bacterium]
GERKTTEESYKVYVKFLNRVAGELGTEATVPGHPIYGQEGLHQRVHDRGTFTSTSGMALDFPVAGINIKIGGDGFHPFEHDTIIGGGLNAFLGGFDIEVNLTVAGERIGGAIADWTERIIGAERD